MAEGGESFSGVQSKLAATTAEWDVWSELTTETTKKLKTAEADIALQLTLRKPAREEIDTHTAKITQLQEQLKAKGADLSQLSAK